MKSTPFDNQLSIIINPIMYEKKDRHEKGRQNIGRKEKENTPFYKHKRITTQTVM